MNRKLTRLLRKLRARVPAVRPSLWRAVIVCLGVVAATAIYALPLRRQAVRVQAGQVAPQDIRVPRDVILIDRDAKPSHRRLSAGDPIVSRGQVVDPQMMILLEDLGLPRGFEWQPALSFLGVCMFVAALLALYLFQYERKLYDQPKLLLLLALIVVAALLVFRIVTQFPGTMYVQVPIAATVAMLVTILLLDAQVALVSTIAVVALTGLMAGSPLPLALTALGSGITALYCVSDASSRVQLWRGGFILATVNVLLALVFDGLQGIAWKEVAADFMLACSSGFVTAVATMGLVMFLERPFGLTTHLRLLELSDPNELALRNLQMTAPGTSVHSMLVSNLAEPAARAIGADPLLTRVAAYYHDLGKSKRPYMFVENQFAGENVHDRLMPSLSALAVIAHVKDGIELARELRLPQPIVDVIAQHHGTTLLTFFHVKAIDMHGEDAVQEESFRYPGPKPQSKEAALVMLADSVEAASRSLQNPTPARIEMMIQKIISDRLNDGQLSECDLTLINLHKIEETFSHILKGLLHSRVEYPEAPSKPRKVMSLESPRPLDMLSSETGESLRSEALRASRKKYPAARHLRRIAGRRNQ